MQVLNYEGSLNSPAVNFDADDGLLKIKGSSLQENSDDFYQPLISWVREYTQNPVAETAVHVELMHFNASTSKCLLTLFKTLEFIQRYGEDRVTIHWYYQPDDLHILNAGQDYNDIVRLEFELIELEEE